MERRNIGKKGLAVICHFEGEYSPKCGWRPITKTYVPYMDPVGIPTIGIGSIAYPDGKRVTMNDPAITVEQAYEYMNFELDEKEDAVQRMILKTGLTINDDQFDALVSMAYNCGVGILEVGTSLRTALMTKDVNKVVQAMGLYVKATEKKWGITRKVTLPGLVRRRKTEALLFSKGEVQYFE